MTKSQPVGQGNVSCSSPSSSYAASSSHITEIDDHDCDLDSGYNDEVDTPLLSTSTHTTPTSPWYDLPPADEMFIWVIDDFIRRVRSFGFLSAGFSIVF